jgi:hypothetical protein
MSSVLFEYSMSLLRVRSLLSVRSSPREGEPARIGDDGGRITTVVAHDRVDATSGDRGVADSGRRGVADNRGRSERVADGSRNFVLEAIGGEEHGTPSFTVFADSSKGEDHVIPSFIVEVIDIPSVADKDDGFFSGWRGEMVESSEGDPGG